MSNGRDDVSIKSAHQGQDYCASTCVVASACGKAAQLRFVHRDDDDGMSAFLAIGSCQLGHTCSPSASPDSLVASPARGGSIGEGVGVKNE